MEEQLGKKGNKCPFQPRQQTWPHPTLVIEGADGRENSLVSPPSPGVTLRLPGVSPTPQTPQDGRRLAILSSGIPPGGSAASGLNGVMSRRRRQKH